MRNRISRYARVGSRALVIAAPLLLVAGVAISAALERLSAEFRSSEEISTIANPGRFPDCWSPGRRRSLRSTSQLPVVLVSRGGSKTDRLYL